MIKPKKVYCANCGLAITSNRLIIVNDGFDRYLVFDSDSCCASYFKKFGFDVIGYYTSSEVESKVAEVRRMPDWSISRASALIIKQQIEKGKLNDKGNDSGASGPTGHRSARR